MIDPFVGLPERHFAVIYADPPTEWQTFSEKGLEGRPQHYARMSTLDIAAMPVRGLAAKDCHLFLWVTGPHLVAGLHLPILRGWGFEPSSIAFVWVKPADGELVPGRLVRWDDALFFKGHGMTTRQNAEYLVLGRRGSPARLSAGIGQVIMAHRGAHSQKPKIFRKRIEEYASGPYLELFSRVEVEGWTCWGDEVGLLGEEERTWANG